MKKQNENAKDPHWAVPVDLPNVKPENYKADIDSAQGSAGPLNPDTRDGTKGFSHQLAGHAKANYANTSSFDMGPPAYTLPGYPSSKEAAGLEEGGRKRQPATSAVVRVPEE